MAKKIIREGASAFRGHCNDCGCEFTYERSDVWTNYVRGGEGVSCPGCGAWCGHFGEGGTSWPVAGPRERGRRSWAVAPRGGYEPSGTVPRGSCFGPGVERP